MAENQANEATSGWQGDHDIFEDEEEKAHLFSVLDSFKHYRAAAHYNVTHIRRQQLYALPSAQWEFLASPPISYLETLNAVDDAIDSNADIADAILESALASVGFNPAASSPEWEGTTTKLDLDKARSTLHQLYRDWSKEGEVERTACYGPVMRDLEERFGGVLASASPTTGYTTDDARPTSTPTQPRVLVPGAGLGRLVFDLARAGYNAEGNELSYHQLFTSSYILNHTTRALQHTLHPFAHTFSNHLRRSDQLASVSIPDIHPGSAQPLRGSMSMTTGDFTAVYGGEEYEGAFDAVATVFFIDTAPNFLAYVETVRKCLRRGGWWINVGPLLWHFGEKEKEKEKEREKSDEEDGEGEGGGGEEKGSKKREREKIGASGGSVQLTNEEVLRIVEVSGFEVEVHEEGEIVTGYVQNSRSMMLNTYRPSHWVARKL